MVGQGCLQIRAISPYRLAELIERDRVDTAVNLEDALRRAEEAEADDLLRQMLKPADGQVRA
jgi:hypothetical protein